MNQELNLHEKLKLDVLTYLYEWNKANKHKKDIWLTKLNKAIFDLKSYESKYGT